ncbi:MAG TPA: hypothetical protein PKM39_02560, partial [Pseudothauera hydrothermalis]|nr:hypothetical protein [Pseudothauera hydrothermalis]
RLLRRRILSAFVFSVGFRRMGLIGLAAAIAAVVARAALRLGALLGGGALLLLLLLLGRTLASGLPAPTAAASASVPRALSADGLRLR